MATKGVARRALATRACRALARVVLVRARAGIVVVVVVSECHGVCRCRRYIQSKSTQLFEDLYLKSGIIHSFVRSFRVSEPLLDPWEIGSAAARGRTDSRNTTTLLATAAGKEDGRRQISKTQKR